MKHPHYVPQFDFVFFNPYHGNFIPRSTQEIFEGKRSVLIGLPGAFTPVCSNYQIPGYEEKADRLKELGEAENTRDQYRDYQYRIRRS